MSEDNLLSVREVATQLGVSSRWVYRAVQRGDLTHVRVGRFMRFRQAELDAYLQRQSQDHTRS